MDNGVGAFGSADLIHAYKLVIISEFQTSLVIFKQKEKKLINLMRKKRINQHKNNVIYRHTTKQCLIYRHTISKYPHSSYFPWSAGNLNTPAESFVVEIGVAGGSRHHIIIPFDTSKVFLFRKIELFARLLFLRRNPLNQSFPAISVLFHQVGCGYSLLSITIRQ